MDTFSNPGNMERPGMKDSTGAPPEMEHPSNPDTSGHSGLLHPATSGITAASGYIAALGDTSQSSVHPSDTSSSSTGPGAGRETVTSGIPSMTAMLLNEAKNAQRMEADVKVNVKGIKLVDPDSANGRPISGQGHLHYRVDDGPIIATTTPKLDFHGLTSGKHTITVMLVGNDHSQIGPSQTLTVNVP